MNGLKIFFVCGLFAVVLMGISHTQINAEAEQAPLWQDVSFRSVSSVRSADRPLPASYRMVRADAAQLKTLLAQAPEYLVDKQAPLELELPMPDGRIGRFEVQEASILEPALAAKYPQIGTFVAQGIDDPTASGRLDFTPAGFHGYIQTAEGDIYIDPYAAGDVTHYISYMKTDSIRVPKFYIDESPKQTVRPKSSRGLSQDVSTGDVRRVYQIVMSATGEFVQYVCSDPGTPCTFDDQSREAALAAIVTGMNRVTQIYEREASISFVVVNGSDDLIFTDPETDPYTNGLDAGQLVWDAGEAAEGRIDVEAYDLGHVVSGGQGAGGGIGWPFSCRGTTHSSKLSGASAIDEPVGDPFWVDYVAHEIGHQFAAEHSYNASAGRACTTRIGSAAFEPGSGSTIMSYAGICDNQNLQNQVDAMFNYGSFVSIIDYATSSGVGDFEGASCAELVPTNNSAPVVEAGENYIIPKDTPFVLTASVSDSEQDQSAITMSWEQYGFTDTQSGGASWPFEDILPNTDQQDGNKRTIFRVLSPSSSMERTLPLVENVLDGTYQNIGEDLPTVAQEIVFRATARDNVSGSGGIGSDTMTLSVDANSGPFRVTSHTTAETIATNQPTMVTWDVASTDVAPVSCSLVTISISADGGQTFDRILQQNSPNDGSETVLVPSTMPLTTNGRIKVACSTNIFFDINHTNLTVIEGEPVELTGSIYLPITR